MGADGEEVNEWNEWRPKAHEHLGEDMTEKTAEQANTVRSEGEESGISLNEDIRTAGKELTEVTGKISEGDFGGAVDSSGRKAIRAAEEPVYKHVMTQISPCYFDNKLISENISRTQDDERQYTFEVNITADELKDQVREQIAAYDETLSHWHIETKKNTETVEAAEGIEPSE